MGLHYTIKPFTGQTTTPNTFPVIFVTEVWLKSQESDILFNNGIWKKNCIYNENSMPVWWCQYRSVRIQVSWKFRNISTAWTTEPSVSLLIRTGLFGYISPMVFRQMALIVWYVLVGIQLFKYDSGFGIWVFTQFTRLWHSLGFYYYIYRRRRERGNNFFFHNTIFNMVRIP